METFRLSNITQLLIELRHVDVIESEEGLRLSSLLLQVLNARTRRRLRVRHDRVHVLAQHLEFCSSLGLFGINTREASNRLEQNIVELSQAQFLMRRKNCGQQNGCFRKPW